MIFLKADEIITTTFPLIEPHEWTEGFTSFLSLLVREYGQQQQHCGLLTHSDSE